MPTFQEILNVTSEKELKKLGNLREVRKIVNDRFGFPVPGKGNGWKGYYARIEDLKKIGGSVELPTRFEVVRSSNEMSPTNSEDGDLFFKSKSARYIYALTKLDGANREEELDIESKLYSNKDLAKKWRDKIAIQIHSDLNPHPFAQQASAKLNELYESMTM